MKNISLTRIYHQESRRLAIFSKYDPELLKVIRRLPGISYSGSNRCWHLADTDINLERIIRAFKEIADIDMSKIQGKVCGDTGKESPFESFEGQKTIRKITNDPGEKRPRLDPVEFRIDETGGSLVIRFTGKYDQSWIDEMKSYGKVNYDRTRREFLMKWSKMKVDSLSDFFSQQNIAIKVVKPQAGMIAKETRKSFGDEVRSRELGSGGYRAIELLRRHLEENRYSARTVETYIPLLELFFRYFNDKDPEMISQEDVSDFINEFIIKNGFSASYQNQVVSAIKLYYEISGRGKVIPVFLERPRRSRALPKVFSKDEVTRILNSSRNLKHNLLLLTIYSCGLRRSEVINIRLTDLDRKRNIIHIREGKGGVDRIVPVAEKLWQKIDQYSEAYSPSKYLFEGSAGGKYSSESVYNVFKQALRRAGINRDVGVHCLRHSYATHLHENGLDIRYIQELLGHKSTRTTEIYTHVSRRNLVNVRSPIEDLDIK